MTALMAACEKGDLRAVEILIENGADIDIDNIMGSKLHFIYI